MTDDRRTILLNSETGDTLDAYQMKRAVVLDYFLGRGGYIYIDKVRNEVRSLRYVAEKNISFNQNPDVIFKDYDINLEHIDLGYCEPQGTLEEVAISGAKYASRKLNKPVIVEDAGLFIKALKGFPGTYSSYVQETLGNQGILKLLDGVNDRYAEFRSVIGYLSLIHI